MATVPDRIFISHSDEPADRAWALWLHGALKQYRLPRDLVARGLLARLGPVRLGEASGPSSWTDAALRESEHLIVVCSTLSPRSARVAEEIARFRALGRAKRIHALLVDGEPRTALPPALLELAPPVTDIRPAPGQDHRHMLRAALLELVAGVLGLDHAVLRRSDEARAASRCRRAAPGRGRAAPR